MLLKTFFIIIIILITLLIGPIWLAVTGQVQFGQNWQTADRHSIGIAPTAGQFKEAVVQLYEARAFNWRGLFAVHTWIAVKPYGATHYTNYQVIGWNAYHNRPIVDISSGAPDRLWFGHTPIIVKSLTGKKAEILITKIAKAAKSYPYAHTYQAWPGPNSNTFIAYILDQTPEFGAIMPANALGKDYVSLKIIITRLADKTGYRLSLWGVLGLIISNRQGVQLNLFGLTLGLSWQPWGVILPGLGLLPKPSNHE
ncbi:hypothetical protein AVI51_10890 [Piscirickettsia salmonis]|uniref:DUF3750 domain-containing protein n=1 Tax=Piscirickettsia salmonis TaxID=1238 RepID=UPI00031969C5|nr:DUF3750 domain-containing protein [Piscirickettsia salmonis]ALA26483.1 hypothetical protein KW89_3027 [Piscirickettsia salmonis]APS43900.1 hypothetical protein AVI48_05620 [Piscirickettsia salmonis]APS47253.1 hypothetical protein AVI49_06225 [Piscirickettsia salmonis]APS51310.1 hypothetical protein AVI50_11005 [Piscirickettsia salmonis]APS54517.1 hypothetical protein AVI51_10890 [Piscirickettsia salmonis]